MVAVMGSVLLARLVAGFVSFTCGVSDIKTEEDQVVPYYASGAFFSLSLSVTPALIWSNRSKGGNTAIGLEGQTTFWLSLLIVSVALLFYVSWARAHGKERKNFGRLFFAVALFSLSSFGFIEYVSQITFLRYYDPLIYLTIILAMLPIQVALGGVHLQAIKSLDA